MVIGYRKLNSVIIADRYRIPDITNYTYAHTTSLQNKVRPIKEDIKTLSTQFNGKTEYNK